MGIAIFLKDSNFSNANLGKVTVSGLIPVESLAIIGDSDVSGNISAATYSVSYTPIITTQREVTWEIVSGDEYASIDETTGVLNVLVGAHQDSVTVRATSVDNPNVYADKTITVSYSSTRYVFGDYLVSSTASESYIEFDTTYNSNVGFVWSVKPNTTNHNTAMYMLGTNNHFGTFDNASENSCNLCTNNVWNTAFNVDANQHTFTLYTSAPSTGIGTPCFAVDNTWKLSTNIWGNNLPYTFTLRGAIHINEIYIGTHTPNNDAAAAKTDIISNAVRHYIPAKDTETGVCGFYDLLGHINQETGDSFYPFTNDAGLEMGYY